MKSLKISAAIHRGLIVFACFLLIALVQAAPLHADSVLNFPRLSSTDGLLTGVAIVNPTSAEATVAITAYGADGNPLKGEGVTNPVSVTIPAGQQYSKLTSEIFGSALPESSASWFQASSSTDGLTGFFLFLNPSLSLMDGADSPVAAQKIIFNNVRIDSGFSSELNIVNSGSSDAHISLQLAGTYFPPAAQALTIPAHGAARLDAASFFSVSSIQPGSYVIVDSDADVSGLLLARSPAADTFALNARRGAEQLGSLYFLQLSVLGSLSSQLSLVNYTADPVVLTISAYKTDGSLYDASSLKFNPVTRALNSKASLSEDLQSMFGFSGSSPLDGWILVKSTSDAVNGFISYGDSSSGAVAAVPSSAEGRTRAIFSHIATTSGFSTGVNLLNPGSVAANVRILALDKSGSILGVFDTVLQPSQRFNRLLGSSDLIPAAANQTGGLVFIKSDQPVYMSSLIRSANAWVNIPAQPAPDSYNPDSAISSLKMIPSIAIIPPGSSQRFSVSGASSSLTWKVNGTTGGSTASGTINSSGVFTAPKAVPARQVVTITAESSSQAAGASADVLDKVPFTSGLGIIQSVTYLDTLGKVYAAELAALASAPSLTIPAAGNSQIFEVPQAGSKISVALFPGEVISKIIPFKADNGTQFLLLAAQTSGQIIRLNPVAKDFKYIVTGLNQPSSIVIDSATGDLLIVEKDKISTVSKASLQADLAAPDGSRLNAPGPVPAPFAALALPASGGAGIAVDRCTGFIYYSLAEQGTIIEYHPLIGTSLIVATGLSNPGQMLGIYRENVTCPDSFQLLVAERGANRVTLVIPGDASAIQWLESPGITDLAFVPIGSPSTTNQAIILADYTLEIGGNIYLVPLSNLYENKPPNPPESAQVEPKVNLAVSQSHDPNPALPYQTLTFTITISNKGPDAATGVSFTDTIPANVSFLSASATQGNCSKSDALVNCNLGSLAVDGTITITILVSPDYFSDAAPRTLRNTAVVTSIEVDTDPANNTGNEDAVITPPQPSKLELSGLPSSVAAAKATTVTVTVRDQFGNVASSYSGNVRFTSTDSSAILPADYTFQASDAGSHSFTVTFRTPGAWSLTATDISVSSLTSTQSTSVSPAQAASFDFSATTSTPSSGAPFGATVIVRDATGQPVSGYYGTISFTSSDTTASLPANYTFAPEENGVHTFSNALVLNQVGTRTITVSDAANASVNATLTFTVGSNTPTQLQVVATPGSVTAGISANVTITVTAQDAFGNTATGFAGTVNMSVSPTYPGTPAEAFTPSTPTGNGVFTFTTRLYLAGTRNFTAQAYVGATPISGSTSVSVTAGATSQFIFTGLPATNTAGNPSSVTLTAADAYKNPTPSFSGTASMSSTDPSGGASQPLVVVSGGSALISVTYVTAGNQTITATSGAITGTSTPTTIIAAGLNKLLLTSPASTTAGTPISVTVTATDLYGNTITNFTGSVQFTSTDPNGTVNIAGINFPMSSFNNYNYVVGEAGVHIFPVTFVTAGNRTVTATSGSFTGTSPAVAVAPAVTTQFIFAGLPTSATSGIATTGITVQTRDTYNNTSTDLASATLSSSDAQGAIFSPTSVTITGGTSAAFSVTFKTVGSQTITATNGAVTTTSAGISVSAGALDHLGINPPTATITAGGSQLYTATGFDLYNNSLGDVTSATTFSISPNGVCIPSAGVFCQAAIAGVHTVTGNDGGKTGTATLTVNPAGLAGFTLSGIPNPTVISNTLTVTAIDSFGNTVTSYTGPVRFSSSDSNGTVNGTVFFSTPTSPLPLAGGIGTFAVNFSTCSPVGFSATLTVADNSNPGTYFGSITPTSVRGPAANFLVSIGATSTTAGTPLDATVTARDFCSNTAIGFTGPATFTSTDPKASLPNGGLYSFLPGDTGAKTFTGGLTLKTATIAGAWTLTATAAGPITGTSAGVTVSAGLTSTFAITIPSTTSAGALISGDIQSQDAYGNDTIVANSVILQPSDPKGQFAGEDFPGPITVTLANGFATFSLFFGTAGNQTITGTDTVTPTITGTSNITDVAAGPPARIIFSNISGSGVAPVAFPGISAITADNYNNPTTYSGPVPLVSSDPQVVFSTNPLVFSNGTASNFSVTFRTAGPQTIFPTPGPPYFSGSSPVIAVSGGAATQLLLGQIPAINATSPFTLSVVAADDYGNPAGANGNSAAVYLGTVSFSTPDTSATINSVLLNSFTYTYVLQDGSGKDFSVILTLGTVGQTITVSATGLPAKGITIQ